MSDETKTFLQDKESLCNTIKPLENEIKRRESHENELKTIIKKNSEQLSDFALENNRLKNCLDELNIQVEFLSSEVKVRKFSHLCLYSCSIIELKLVNRD